MKKQWIAFYDASGSQADTQREPIVVAGLLSTSHRWVRFDTQWKGVLEGFDVPYLHMREFTAFKGPFAHGWRGDDARQAAFLGGLGRAIKRWVNKGWTAYIPQRIYDEVDCHYYLKEGTGGSYSLAAMLCAGMIVDWLGKHHAGDTLVNLFASGDAGQHGFRQSASLANITPNFWPTRHPTTGDWFGPFQAADLVAYEYRTEFHRGDEQARTREVRGSLRFLNTHIPFFHRQATTEGLMGFCAAHPHIFRPRN